MKHARRPAATTGLGLLLACLLLGVLNPSSASVLGGQSRAGTAERAATAPLKVGISYGERLTHMSPAALASALDDARRVGVGWVRMDFSWTSVQPSGPSSYRWGPVDRVVAAARARGLKVLPILTFTPAWARDAGCSRFTCPPHRPRVFARFASTAAKRYAKLGVRTWEVWNEPNHRFFWPHPSATRYTTLLQRTFHAIRAVDPGATVLMGGLSALEDSAPSIGPREFLRAVCRAGGCATMNGVAYHPYTYPYVASRYSTSSAWSKINQTPWSLRSVLDKAGFPRKKIWVTEYGAPTEGPGSSADGTPTSILPTEWGQAQQASDVVRTADANEDVLALFWYTNQDLSLTNRREASFGLRRLNGSAKPSWFSFSAAVAQIG